MSRILKVLGLYTLYLILTIIIFYILGMYVWTTPPTKLVLVRMLGLPFMLTFITIVIIYLIKKNKNT